MPFMWGSFKGKHITVAHSSYSWPKVNFYAASFKLKFCYV